MISKCLTSIENVFFFFESGKMVLFHELKLLPAFEVIFVDSISVRIFSSVNCFDRGQFSRFNILIEGKIDFFGIFQPKVGNEFPV